MSLLLNKSVIVTGAGRGIGSSIARLFAANGAKVVVHFNNSAEAAARLAAEIAGTAIQADLRKQEHVERLVQEALAAVGSIDILVNNAASFSHAASSDDETWDDYTEEWNGVFGTTYRVITQVAPVMKEQGGGRIINFGATLIQRPASGYGAHTCAKAAVLALTRNLAKELGPFRINVNAVSPGMTLTEFTNSLSPGDREKVSAITPLRRLATPDDVANVCLFLASDMAAFVTGANILPDGGLAQL